MKILQRTLYVFFAMSLQVSFAHESKLSDIKNYNYLSAQLASAGMPTADNLQVLKENGFEHVINLLPGDFSEEKGQLAALGMSFDQVAVDWNMPTLENYQQFALLMKQYQGAKVLVHCQLNYRASAFSYLHEVLELGVEPQVAQKKILAIWQPNETWLAFINTVQENQAK